MQWQTLRLWPITSGCPNRCRHCCDEAGPPYGALMSLDDVKWIVGEFARVWEDTFGASAQVRIIQDGFEPTAHPDFLRLWQYALSFWPEERRGEFGTILGTNGYGLARAGDWEHLFEEMLPAGIGTVGISVFGLEEEHDWFAQRKGAYQDIVIAAGRALDSGMGLNFEISLNKRNLASFSSIVEALEELGHGQARIWSGVPAFYMNDRLRAFEALRITKAEHEMIADALPRAPDRGSNTEASYTRLLTDKGREAGLCTYEAGGKGPDQRHLGWLVITPAFEVIERFDSRPSIPHGNLKREGVETVWASVLNAELPLMPEPDALARAYGDFPSEALHPGAGSVYMKLCDKYWAAAQD